MQSSGERRGSERGRRGQWVIRTRKTRPLGVLAFCIEMNEMRFINGRYNISAHQMSSSLHPTLVTATTAS